jgi:hypothetical protein
MNYDRTPKQFGYDPRIINESDVLPIDAAPIQRCATGQQLTIPVASAHFSTTKHENVVLKWHLSGIDSLGRLHQDLERGSQPIKFPHRQVAHAHDVPICLPEQTMICRLDVEAVTCDNGEVAARNFIQFLVTDDYPAEREELTRITVLRAKPWNWARSEWTGYAGDREKERAEDAAWGFGRGYFEYEFPLEDLEIAKAYRLRILCEASARRMDTPQTDNDLFPTTLQMSLNGIPVIEELLPNHPHDARGVLSYLRGAPGGYGYLARGTVEGAALQRVLERTEGRLVLRLAVPETSLSQNGLQIYGAENGRFPICPTIGIEW